MKETESWFIVIAVIISALFVIEAFTMSITNGSTRVIDCFLS